MPYSTKTLNIIGYAKPLPFNITSGEMMVTDPCYEKGTWCQAELEQVKLGQWFGSVAYSDEQRVAQLMVWHESATVTDPSSDFPSCDEFAAGIGVDSGQASFFDSAHYPDDPSKDQPFYDMVCDWTLSSPDKDQLIAAGVYRLTGELLSQSGMEWLAFYKAKQTEGKVCIGRGPGNDMEAAFEDRSQLSSFVAEHGLGGFGGNEHGVASSSGFGDGGYECYVERNATGEIIAARIDFIVPEDEEKVPDNEDEE